MGSAFYTYEQAATRLNRSKRTIYLLIKKGMLRKESCNGVLGVSAVDVEDLATQTELPAMNKSNWDDLQIKVRRMEERMAVLTEILGFKSEPIRPSINNAADLYIAAKKAVEAGSWVEEEVMTWAGIFKRIDEATLKVIAEAVSDTTPWIPFFELCALMQGKAETEYSRLKNIQTERVFLVLEDCKKHLRSVAVVWADLGLGNAASVVLKSTASQKENLMSRIMGKTL